MSFIIFAIISNLQIRNLENRFNNLYEGISEVKIVGTIISNRRETQYKAIYTVKVTSINSSKKFKDTNLFIYVPKSKKIEYGDQIVINGIFENAKTARNYKEFNYREYLKSKNIYGIVYVEELEIVNKNNLNYLLMGINKLREKIKTNLNEILGKESYITIRNTSAEIHLKFQIKLYKILKIAVFIIYWQYLARTSGYIIIGLTSCLNTINASKRKIKPITAIFLLLFMALTGFSPSVIRACIMSIIILMSRNIL